MTENEFRDRHIIPFLKRMPLTKYFIKQANSVRGIPDIICCINGKYIELEVKKDKNELSKPRHKLQEYEMQKTRNANGWAFTVYPDNWEEVKSLLISLVC
jgi:hypothetical protein